MRLVSVIELISIRCYKLQRLNASSVNFLVEFVELHTSKKFGLQKMSQYCKFVTTRSPNCVLVVLFSNCSYKICYI